MKVKRVDDGDDNVRFNILVDGQVAFLAEREELHNGKYGHWLLFKPTAIGPVIVDRDQYSNDLMERVECGLYDNIRRFKLKQTKAEFNRRRAEILADAEFAFDGEWVAEYYDWEGCGVYCKKV